MAKKVISIILAISMIMSLCCTVSFASGVVVNAGGATKKVEVLEENKGEVLEFPITVSGIDKGVTNYEINVTYDANYLTPVVENESCLKKITEMLPSGKPYTYRDTDIDLEMVIDNSSTAGVITILGTTTTPVSVNNPDADNKLFVINFKINESITKRTPTKVGVEASIKYLDAATGGAIAYEGVVANSGEVIINSDVITPVDITLSDLEATYDANEHKATVALSEKVGYTITYDGKADAPVDAGSYEVEVTVNEAGFEGSKKGTLVISPAPVTVTAVAAEKYVGQTDPELNFTYVGPNGGSLYKAHDNFSGALTREVGEAADTYNIKLGTLKINDNYKITFVPATFTIKPKLDQNVAAKYPIPTGKRYGDVGFRWEFELDGVSGCTEKSYTSSNTNVATVDANGDVTIVGAGSTTITFKVKGSEIYNEYVDKTDLVVDKRDLDIVIEDKIEILGSGAPLLSYDIVDGTVLADGDMLEVLLERSAGNALDTPYEISAKSIVIKNNVGKDVTSNYNIDVTNGTYTIIAKLLQNVEVSEIASPKTYGDGVIDLTVTDNEANVTGSIAVTSDNAEVAVINADGDIEIIGAGTAKIKVFRAGNDEYADLNVEQTLVVKPRTLKIKAKNLSVKIGRDLPSLDGQWELTEGSLVGADAITGALAYEDGANTSVSGVTFAIEQGTLTAGSNYNIEFTNGELSVIEKTPQVIEVADIGEKTYGDSSFALVVTKDAVSEREDFEYSISGSADEQTETTVATVSADGNVTITGAGTAYITVTEPGDADYAPVSVVKELVVKKAPLTATVTAIDKIYGQTLEAATVTYTGFVNGEDESAITTLATVTGMPEGIAPAGDYPIEASGGEAANYEISYVGDTFTIGTRVIYVDSVDVYDKNYDGTNAATINPTATVLRAADYISGILSGDDVVVAMAATSAAFDSADAGIDKVVTFTDLSATLDGEDSGNYEVFINTFAVRGTIYAVDASMTAQQVADQIGGNIPVTKDDEALVLPTVPEGYEIRIKTSDNESVLALDGTINALDIETVVNVTFEVVSLTDETDVGTTTTIPVTIPKANKKMVSVSVMGDGSVVGNYGEQTVGTLIELAAVPGVRHAVGEWVVNGVSIGKIGSTYSFTLVDDIDIVVEFYSTGGTYRPSGSSGGSVSYTVTFNSNDGSKVESQKVTSGNVAEEPTAPTKEGYIFAGWYKESSLTNKFDFASKIKSNITLYAKWEIDNTKNQIILTIGENDALVFGEAKTNDVEPVIENDRTMLPARFVAENLGATVEWDEASSKVTITKGDIVIEITIGAEKALVNGEEVLLDSPAFLRDSRTYTPIRFISEALGATVEWVEEEEKVIITPAAEENTEA